jgi:hypothetical protein
VIKADGTLACWGWNADGACTPPSGAFSQISAGSYHTCGVRVDGTLACWGYNSDGQSNPPSGTFSRVSAGWTHTCGIKSDGTLACWGSDTYGQLSNVPSGAFIQVSADYRHTCGTRVDGTVACWGYNPDGQAPTCTISPSTLPAINIGQEHSVQLSASMSSEALMFEVMDGALPPGFYLTCTGTLDERPARGGTYTFTIRVNDANRFSTTQTYSLEVLGDTDRDWMGDDWEVQYFGSLSPTGAGDYDNDGLIDVEEYWYHTDPTKKDTDGDGMLDRWEMEQGFDPRFNDANEDADEDGYTNLEEYLRGSDPRNVDSRPIGVRWYVNDNIPFSGDGQSWPAAFKTVQEAVDAAIRGEEIWVKASTYSLSAPILLQNKRGLSVFGGFAGDETERNQRNWHVYPTTLDGQGSVPCLLVGGTGVTFDGFIITHCHGDMGGGALVAGSTTFANNEFINNTADLGGAVYNYGAGARVTFENCAFFGNSATQGGAVYNEEAYFDTTRVEIWNCTFSGNVATTSAGAIANGPGIILVVGNSILWGDKEGTSASEIVNDRGAVTVGYSDIQGGHPGTGNLDADPQFVDAAGGILSLKPASPCIDKVADNVFIGALDLDHNPRLMDGDGGGAIVDMGAYEYDPEVMTFIGHYYHSILNRDPDGGGSRWWRTGISQLTSQGVSLNEGFLALAKNFFNSSEYLGNNKSDVEFLTDLYQAFFDREPDSEGFAFWLGYLDQGLTRNGVMYSFAYSPEFRQLLEDTFGSALARPEVDLVNDCYRGILARFPDVQGFKFWVTTMRNAQCAGISWVKSVARQLAADFFNSAEYAARNRDHSGYVEDLYGAVMRRGPDPDGFNFWLGLLQGSVLTRRQLQDAFINSGEFQDRVQDVIAAGCMQ